MGQYYHIAFRHEGESPVVNFRKVKGAGYIMAKLMEHSWFGTYIVNAAMKELMKGKTRIAWVGDYADDDVEKVTGGELSYSQVWPEDEVADCHTFPLIKRFPQKGLHLINHTKREYISLDAYKSHYPRGTKWIEHPLPILTAVGNGLGGGDYEGTAMDRVGSWAWDELSVSKNVPEGYALLDIFFKEDR